jgi:hypothetical protein
MGKNSKAQTPKAKKIRKPQIAIFDRSWIHGFLLKPLRSFSVGNQGARDWLREIRNSFPRIRIRFFNREWTLIHANISDRIVSLRFFGIWRFVVWDFRAPARHDEALE